MSKSQGLKALNAVFNPTSPCTKAAASIARAPGRIPSPEAHFITLIHASKTLPHFHQIHAQIIHRHLFSNSRVVTQLISSSCLLGSLDYAISIFRCFHRPNLFVFNALIRGLAENCRFESSVSHFVLMLRLNVRPDRLTLPYVLKSVAALVDLRLGRCLHVGVVKLGLEFDSFVRVSLVDMYVKVGGLSFALLMFDESPERNKAESILLWNVLINGCCKAGDLGKATALFDAMPERNAGSWNSLIHRFIQKGIWTELESFLFRCPRRLVSWTTMINGFSRGHEKALSIFWRMLDEGVSPNVHTVVSVLAACTKVGARAGVRIHNYLLTDGFRLNRAVGTALVDMYAKCGNFN